MALSMLSGDEQGIVLFQLYNVLDPRLAVDFSSVSHEVWEPTRALLQQLRADHKVAAALGHKAGMRSCKEMREAKEIKWMGKALSETDLATLGTLGSVLPALERLELLDSPTRVLRTHWGMLRLAERLGAGALQALTYFATNFVHPPGRPQRMAEAATAAATGAGGTAGRRRRRPATAEEAEEATAATAAAAGAAGEDLGRYGGYSLPVLLRCYCYCGACCRAAGWGLGSA